MVNLLLNYYDVLFLPDVGNNYSGGNLLIIINIFSFNSNKNENKKVYKIYLNS